MRGRPLGLGSHRSSRRRGARRPWARSSAGRGVLLTVVLVLVLAAGLGVGAWRFTSNGGGGSGGRGAATQTSTSADVRGRVVVLDPGHDGGNGTHTAQIDRMVDAGGFQKECDTVGASTDAGYPEHAFTIDVARRAAALLHDRGVTVILTRDDDDGVGPCVDERARIGNAAGADAAVSIHADGGPAEGTGFHVIAPARSPDGTNTRILGPSARLAGELRDAFAAATGEPHADYTARNQGLVERADLGGLNLSRVPKVFVECANMRNPTDATHVTDPGWRQRAAVGISTGILRYLTAGAPDAS